MLEGIVSGVIESVIQVVGWGVLKVFTLGRYRGFRDEDLLLEGAIGLASIVVGSLGLTLIL